MDTEAEAVNRMIDKAQENEITVEWVNSTMKLMQFLRTVNATIKCLENVDYWRKFSPDTIFMSIDERIEDQERIERLIIRHEPLESAYICAKIIRELNLVRLKEPLVELDSDMRITKGSL